MLRSHGFDVRGSPSLNREHVHRPSSGGQRGYSVWVGSLGLFQPALPGRWNGRLRDSHVAHADEVPARMAHVTREVRRGVFTECACVARPNGSAQGPEGGLVGESFLLRLSLRCWGHWHSGAVEAEGGERAHGVGRHELRVLWRWVIFQGRANPTRKQSAKLGEYKKTEALSKTTKKVTDTHPLTFLKAAQVCHRRGRRRARGGGQV